MLGSRAPFQTSTTAYTRLFTLFFKHFNYNNNSKYDTKMKENGTRVKLETSDCEKDLGVNIDKDLKYSKHSEVASNKANRIMGMIKCSFNYIDKKIFNCIYSKAW